MSLCSSQQLLLGTYVIGMKIIHESDNVCIGVGKEPEVGEWAAEGEFMLSVNSLLMCHLSPESKCQEAAENNSLILQQSDTEAACGNLDKAS